MYLPEHSNGSLGECVARHLQKDNFNVKLLTRSLDKTKAAFPGLPAFEVNYGSVERFTEAVRTGVGKQDALIILINRNESQAQTNLIDAAITVGISHIIPSAFSDSTRNPVVRGLQSCDRRLIQNGAFLDWALDRDIYINTKDPNGTTMVLDGGDIPFFATNVDDIGRAVAMSLVKVDQVRNKDVHIHTAVITQNQLLKYAREAVPGREFKVKHVDTAELEAQANERYNDGDGGPATMAMFMPRITFERRVGFFKDTDNGLLGIEELSDEQVRTFVAGYMR